MDARRRSGHEGHVKSKMAHRPRGCGSQGRTIPFTIIHHAVFIWMQARIPLRSSRAQWTMGWGVQPNSGPQTPRPGEGGPEGGGGGLFSRDLGGLLNSLFYSEHFEYTQVRGVQPPFTIHHKWGGNGGREGALCPVHRGHRGPGAAGAWVGCSSLFTVGVGCGS